MSKFMLRTRNGVLDRGQEAELARLAAELSQPNSKLLLHLHGGLVDEDSGNRIAERLSGNAPDSWRLGAEWTQVYVIWRTGALETFKENWQDLVTDDRLYQVIVRKLIEFVARRVGIPTDAARGPGTFAISDVELRKRMSGGAGPRPFDDIDQLLVSELPVGSRAVFTPEQSSGELAIQFQSELKVDADYQSAVRDIDEAINVLSGARVASPGANANHGARLRARLDDNLRGQLTAPPAIPGQARGVVWSGAILLEHATKVAVRCFKRFKRGRDHGLHATIVEEVCREFYGDLVGAKVWGMMVKDASDHFLPDNLGAALINIVKENPPQSFILAGHSAGTIWASRFLLAAKAAGLDQKVKLLLLAPAVRETLFAEVVETANDLIDRCLMITMTDELERGDAVLGHDKGYIYPSSLLYLVSGMFEERDSQSYIDAPLLGMRRFDGLGTLEADEAAADAKISAFFQLPGNGIILSPTLGMSMSDTHGGFDSEPLTLATARAIF